MSNTKDFDLDAMNAALANATWESALEADDDRDTIECPPYVAPKSPSFGWERGWFVLIPAAVALLLMLVPSMARAETVTFEADTITATAGEVPAACFAGDPLCSSDLFVCRDDGAGRTCETLAGWVERQTVAAHTNTVGKDGWH